MFRTQKVAPGLPPGSPLRIRTDNNQQPEDGEYVHVDTVVEAQRKRIVFMLLKGEIYGLPGSTGTRWSNFREWAKNQHPVLSMFFAHELHPFSRSERLSVMMCYLCWAFFITVVFEAGNVDGEAICNPGCKNRYVGRLADSREPEEICGAGSGINTDKVSVDTYEQACDEVTPWFVLSFIIAALTVPYSTILKALATCACAQSMPSCCRLCAECLGALVLRLFGVLSVVWLALGISISLSLDGGMFLVTYLAGVVKSWFYWPIIAGTVFTFKYKKKRALFNEAHPGQIAMAWPISERDLMLDIKVGKDGQPVAYMSPPGTPKAEAPSPQAGAEDTPTPQPSPNPQPGGLAYNGGQMTPPPQPLQPSSPSHGMYAGGVQQPPGGPGYTSPYGQGYPGTPPPGQGAPGYGGFTGGGGGGGGSGLPPGWEMKMEPNGRMLYIDHNTKISQWDPPPMQYQQQAPMSPGNYSGQPPLSGFAPQHMAPNAGYGGMQQQPMQNQYPGQHPPIGYPGQQPGYRGPHSPPGLHGQYPPHQHPGQYPPPGQPGQYPTPGYPQPQQTGAHPGYGDPLVGSTPGGYPTQQMQQGYTGQQQMVPPPTQAPPEEAPAPVPSVMEFQVPDGVSAGDVVQITAPTGVLMQVTIPEGSSSGDTLRIPVPN